MLQPNSGAERAPSSRDRGNEAAMIMERNPKRAVSRAWGPKRDDGLERVTNRRPARRPSEHALPDGSITIAD